MGSGKAFFTHSNSSSVKVGFRNGRQSFAFFIMRLPKSSLYKYLSEIVAVGLALVSSLIETFLPPLFDLRTHAFGQDGRHTSLRHRSQSNTNKVLK